MDQLRTLVTSKLREIRAIHERSNELPHFFGQRNLHSSLPNEDMTASLLSTHVTKRRVTLSPPQPQSFVGTTSIILSPRPPLPWRRRSPTSLASTPFRKSKSPRTSTTSKHPSTFYLSTTCVASSPSLTAHLVTDLET